MSENPITEIEALKQQLAAAQALQKTPEPKVEPKPKKKRKQPKAAPPILPVAKPSVVESGMCMIWIDNRYQIHGVHGIPGGNIITLNSLPELDGLIANLTLLKKEFNQPDMLSTKE